MTETLSATWRDKKILIKIPNGVQVMMWGRIANEFGKIADADEVEPDQFRKSLNRLSDIVFGMIVDEADVEWLEDEIMAGRVVDADLLDLFTAIRDAANAEADKQDGSAPVKKSTAKKVK